MIDVTRIAQGTAKAIELDLNVIAILQFYAFSGAKSVSALRLQVADKVMVLDVCQAMAHRAIPTAN